MEQVRVYSSPTRDSGGRVVSVGFFALVRMTYERVVKAEHKGAKWFGHQPEIKARAAGSINTLGEHTDYNDGIVLSAGIDKPMVLATSANNNKQLRVYSTDVDETIEVNINEPDHQNKGWAILINPISSRLHNRPNMNTRV